MSTAEQVCGEVELEHGESGTYYTDHDMARGGLTVTIAIALGKIDGTPPETFVDSFGQYCDPDALDRLFRTLPGGATRDDGHLSLTIEGYGVTVYSTGTIAIDAPEH